MDASEQTTVRRPEVGRYRDYRRFLRDMVVWLKANRRGFSYRSFSRSAGFSSPNFLKQVAEGQRNLSNTSIGKFARGLGLDEAETRVFELLVRLDQAQTDEERNRCYRQLREAVPLDGTARVEADQYELYTRWYNVVIRELLTLGGARLGLTGSPDDAARIGKRLWPRVGARQVARALRLLERLRLLVRDETGRPQAVQAQITTGPVVRSLAIRNFHRRMLDLAGRALDTVPTEQRDVTSVTVPLTPEAYESVRGALAQLRREVLALSESAQADAAAEIYQLELALFPVSRNPATKETDR